MRIKFILPGKPVAQGRPRFYRKGSFVVATDPKPSKVYKADIAYIGQKARTEAGIEGLFDGPLGMEIFAYFPCPKSKWRVKEPRKEEEQDSFIIFKGRICMKSKSSRRQHDRQDKYQPARYNTW